MIPMPGLELVFRMLVVTVWLTLAVALLSIALAVRARRKWSGMRPAPGELRVAFGALVWTFLWMLLFLPDGTVLVALVPFLLSAGGFAYIASGNRRRGHANPGLLLPGVTGLALFIVTLFVVSYAVRVRRDAIAREDAKRIAEGKRDQDEFQALARASDGTIAAIGTTSTRPNDAYDIWVHAIDGEGTLLASKTFPIWGDQQGLAIAIGQDGTWILGGQDEDHPFLAVATRDSIVQSHRWDGPGAVSAIAPSRDGGFLLGGESDSGAWIGLVDRTLREVWRKELGTPVDHARVSSLALVGDGFVAAGSDHVFASGAFVVSGTLGGHIDWVQPFRADRNGLRELTDVCVRSDGSILAFGSRGSPGQLGDLWLLHLSRDGKILDESTFGDVPGERAGGFALGGEELILVGHQFPGLGGDVLWMRAMDTGGGSHWERTYPDTSYGRATDVTLLPGGDILLVGYRTLHNKRDAWAARLDREGLFRWQRTYPASR